jgi:hypothetical protein
VHIRRASAEQSIGIFAGGLRRRAPCRGCATGRRVPQQDVTFALLIQGRGVHSRVVVANVQLPPRTQRAIVVGWLDSQLTISEPRDNLPRPDRAAHPGVVAARPCIAGLTGRHGRRTSRAARPSCCRRAGSRRRRQRAATPHVPAPAHSATPAGAGEEACSPGSTDGQVGHDQGPRCPDCKSDCNGPAGPWRQAERRASRGDGQDLDDRSGASAAIGR